MRARAPHGFPVSGRRQPPHFTSGAPCPACAEEDGGGRAIARLVRAAYRGSDSPEIPGELLRRVLAAREDSTAGLVSILADLAASPLLALSIGL